MFVLCYFIHKMSHKVKVSQVKNTCETSNYVFLKKIICMLLRRWYRQSVLLPVLLLKWQLELVLAQQQLQVLVEEDRDKNKLLGQV